MNAGEAIYLSLLIDEANREELAASGRLLKEQRRDSDSPHQLQGGCSRCGKPLYLAQGGIFGKTLMAHCPQCKRFTSLRMLGWRTDHTVNE